MNKPVKTQFVIADGGRARWVRRNPSGLDFETHRQLAAERLGSDGPQGVVFEGSSGARFSVEEKDTAVRAHKGRFPDRIAREINAAVERGEIERLAVIAPTRSLAAITRRLSPDAQTRLAGTLAKDLTKTPDDELGTWLRSLELGG